MIIKEGDTRKMDGRNSSNSSSDGSGGGGGGGSVWKGLGQWKGVLLCGTGRWTF